MELEIARRNSKIEVLVTDTGRGIAAEDLTRIFQPFEQAGADAAESKGTGLGLPLSKRLVELHGGHISVESVVGAGSRFTVSLPLHEVPALSKDPGMISASPDQDLNLNKRTRVLVAEDSESNGVLIFDVLSEAGFEVAMATNGQEAVKLAQTFHPDVVLMDMRMPVMGGLEATQRLKASPLTRNIPVIALTAQAMSGDKDQCYEAGCDGYLTKPVDLDEMIHTVQAFSIKLHKPVPEPAR